MPKKTPWIKEEITREIREYLGTNEDENTTYKTYGMQQKDC